MKKFIADKRGSSLLATMLAMIILSVLGLGVLAITLTNAKQAKHSANFESAYYYAESKANTGLDAIKKATSEVYNDMMEGDDLYDTFFNEIQTRALSSIGTSETTDDVLVTTSVSHATAGENLMKYTVTAVASIGSVSREVTGTVTVERVSLSSVGFPPDTIVAGGTLSALSVDIRNIGEDGLFLLVDDATVNINSISVIALLDLRWWLGLYTIYDYLEDTDGHVDADQIKVGQISTSDISWDLDIPNIINTRGTCTTITALNNVSYSDRNLYCNRNLTISRCNLTNVNIYCTGTVTFSAPSSGSGYSWTNVNVYALGDITFNSLASSRLASASQIRAFSNNDLTIASNISKINGVIAYARDELSMYSQGSSNYVRGLVYAGDLIDAWDCNVQGQVVAAHNINYQRILEQIKFKYDEALVVSLLNGLPDDQRPHRGQGGMPTGPFFSNEDVSETE